MNSSIPTKHSNGKINPAEGTLLHPAEPTAEKGKEVTYPFVNLIRFIATIGIVFLHSGIPLAGNDYNAVIHQVNHIEYYLLLRQIFKFATICYFMIAGFLLADKVTGANPFHYYKRRFDVLVKPYLLSFAIFIILLLIRDYALTNEKFKWYYILTSMKFSLLYTAYWYVPNYLLSLLIIVGFAKYIQSPYFGALLFVLTLYYTWFDVYSSHHTASHTTALLGFVFYMWLGVYIKKNNLVQKIKNLNLLSVGVVLILIFLLSNCESYYLFHYTQNRDSLNTLRISNQLYSIVAFVFLVRYCDKPPNFGIFNPRNETYGIYLYHSFFTFFVLPSVENWMSYHYHISLFSYNVFGMIGMSLLNCAISYFTTTALVKILLRYKLAFLPAL
jgi:hypothetical protein